MPNIIMIIASFVQYNYAKFEIYISKLQSACRDVVFAFAL